MKATLEFSLPEESAQLEAATRAADMRAALEHVDNLLRNCLKHGGDAARTMQTCREEIGETLQGLK